MRLSLWLTFADPVAQELQSHVADFARHNGTACFVPHMTVVGDIDLRRDAAAQLAETIAPAFAGLSGEVVKLGTGATYFQSVFLELALDPTVTAMRNSLLSQFDKSPAYPPHVSLAYGINDPAALQGKLDQIGARFGGTRLAFAELVVMASSEDRPVKDWRPLHAVPL